MRAHAAELYWLDLELNEPLVTARGTHTRRPVVMVRLLADDAEGFGECAALAERWYFHESAQDAWEELSGNLLPKLLAHGGELRAALAFTLTSPAQAKEQHPMARAALEMAGIDAILRGAGISLAHAIGARETAVAAGAVLGEPVTGASGAHMLLSSRGGDDAPVGSRRELVERAIRLARRGYRRIRLKVSPATRLGVLQEVVDNVHAESPDVLLQVDANGAFLASDPEHRRLIMGMDGLGLAAIEQPFEARDLLAHAALSEFISTPVCLDESLSSPSQVERALEIGACQVACLKPARLGGVAKTLQAWRACRLHGVAAFVGGMLETPYARAANAALAALPGFVLPGDLSLEPIFSEPALREAFWPAGGYAAEEAPGAFVVPVHQGPGVAPAPVMEIVKGLATRKRTLIGSRRPGGSVR